MTKPLKQPGGWQECGGMYRWKARGFLYKFVRKAPSLSVIVRSINSMDLIAQSGEGPLESTIADGSFEGLEKFLV